MSDATGKPFTGSLVRFGALVNYTPPKPEREAINKFDLHTVPGIFIGWHIDPGGEWHGDYLLLRQSDFESEDARIYPIRVKEIVMPDFFEYPLKIAKDSRKFSKLLERDDDGHAPGDKEGPKVKHVDASTQTNSEDAGKEETKPATLKKNYTDISGRPTRGYKGTSRPPDLWPEDWLLMSRKQRRIAADEYKAKQAVEEGRASCEQASSSSSLGKPQKIGEPADSGDNRAAASRSVETVAGDASNADNDNKETSAIGEPAESGDNRAAVSRSVESAAGLDSKADSNDDVLSDLNEHRDKTFGHDLWNAAVTLTLHPSDPRSRCKEAKDAVSLELAALRDRKTWAEDKVMERSDARRLYPDAHFAGLFPILGIKNHESSDTRDHRWKGRVVLGGHKIKTASGDWAIFTDVGSTPSTMAAARTVLAVSALLPGYKVKQSDCIRAYTQSKLKGPKTFVSLPREWWPDDWRDKYTDPVCELILALYGHPKAGDCWHDKLDDILVKHKGFRKIEGWPSVYYKVYQDGSEREVVVFVVYVDDLIMVGGKRLEEVIREVRQSVDMEEPSELNKYLGCFHEIKRTGDVTNVTWNMSDFIRSAVSIFETDIHQKLTPASTPYATELPKEQFLANVEKPGRFAKKAASYLMKLMYPARMCCPNLTVPVQRLATQVNKWSLEADRRLIRLYQYAKFSADWQLTGTLSTKDLADLELRAWPDADLCGDVWSARSTSGFFLELAGREGRSFPLSWGSKRQGSTSNHTQEAEIVSLSSCLRSEVIPTQLLLQVLLGKALPAFVYEDNAACIIAVDKGYSPTLRYLPRTQRIAISFLKEVLRPGEDDEQDDLIECEGQISLEKIETVKHKGDVFTKELPRSSFEYKMNMLGMRPRL